MTAAAADFDGDGWVDLYVACDSTAAILYHNNADGTFSDMAVRSGAAYDPLGNAQAGMGLAVADFDRDGQLDLLKTHFADDIPALYRNLGGGLFEDVAVSAGLGVENRHVEWGAGMPDLDNDGWPDLFYVTGRRLPGDRERDAAVPHRGPRVVFRNQGGVRFLQVTDASGPAPRTSRSSRGAAFGDFDNDGDVDLLVMNMNEPPSLLRNDYSGKNAWLAVRLVGRRSNRMGFGATVVVSSAGSRQAQAVLSQSSYYSHDDRRLHFGLGRSERATRSKCAGRAARSTCYGRRRRPRSRSRRVPAGRETNSSRMDVAAGFSNGPRRSDWLLPSPATQLEMIPFPVFA